MVIIDEGGFVPMWIIKLVTKRNLKALRSKSCNIARKKSKNK